MKSRSPVQKLTLAKRRELEVAAAVALEEVMQFHVASGLQLIELADGRVSAGRMVDIYIRLHAIRGAQAEMLMFSILAALGQRSPNGPAAALVVEGEDKVARDARSLFRILRGRLRGRVHHELRRAIEVATGAAQVRLLEIHVRHALRFARELSGTHAIGAAIDQYAGMTEVPDGMRTMLYAFVLERLAAEELPSLAGTAPLLPQRLTSLHRPRPKKVV